MGKVVNKDEEKFGKISAMEKKFLSLGDAEDYLFRWQTIEQFFFIKNSKPSFGLIFFVALYKWVVSLIKKSQAFWQH